MKRMKEYFRKTEPKKYYGGHIIPFHIPPFTQGSGMTFSKDLAIDMINKEQYFLNTRADDVEFTMFIKRCFNIDPVDQPMYDTFEDDKIHLLTPEIAKSHFHFRCKEHYPIVHRYKDIERMKLIHKLLGY